MTDILYFSIALSGLTALCAVLVVIGRAAAECPQTAGAARLGTWVITAGFAAIGVGIVALVGAILPVLESGRASGLYLATGIVAIVLGIGFYNAAQVLRDLMKEAQKLRSDSAA